MSIKEKTVAFRILPSTSNLIDELVSECDCAPSHFLRMALADGLQRALLVRDTKREDLTLMQALTVSRACGMEAIK